MLRFLLGRRDPAATDAGAVKVIMGLGNPGPEYEKTRHNVGWWVVDHLADVWRFDGWRKDGRALVARGEVAGHAVRLVKPLTYMNLSGGTLAPFLRKPSWSPADDLLVVLDEVALPVGRYRLRARGSDGGHNGLKSIERAVGGREYPRLRIGVGPGDPTRRPEDLSDFVLSPFAKSERQVVLDLLPRVRDAVEAWLRDGIERAMNLHNRKSSQDG